MNRSRAFNTVEHIYLWSVLKASGFSSEFIEIITIVYCGIESILKINGDL